MIFATENPFGNPAEHDLYVFLGCVVAVLIVAVLVKNLFAKQPPEHERWADKKTTNERLAKIEDELKQVRIQAGDDKDELSDKIEKVPEKVIHLLKQTKGLL